MKQKYVRLICINQLRAAALHFVTALMGSEFAAWSASDCCLDHDDDTYLFQVAGWDADAMMCRCQMSVRIYRRHLLVSVLEY